mmetsp:Transcript_4098/g.6031  ORF Transcript_4098/g.6031 Transcript_4098/m.6031 type:complete len:102 (-) Transcript_4098:18-323(-)
MFSSDSALLDQDNKSSILLKENGRGSSGKRTHHINVRYDFIKNRVKRKDIKIQHFPTMEMIADFFTKPLLGSLYIKFRNFIMNNDDHDEEISHHDHRSVLE